MARKRDPISGKLLPEGIHPIVSQRTGKVTYRARISYGPVGDRRHIGETFKNAGAAEDWLLTRRMEVNRGEIIDPSQMTCAEFFASWHLRKSKNWSGSRAITVRTAWERYAAPIIGRMKIQSVRQLHIQQIVDHLEEINKAPSTVKLYVVGYTAMFNAAIASKIVRENPCHGVVTTEGERKQTQTWNAQQLETFLKSEADADLFPFWAYLIGTASRIGEGVAVFREDIAVDTQSVWIHRTVARNHQGQLEIVNRTKSGEDGRVVPLEGWVIDAINELPQDGERVFESITDINRVHVMYRDLRAAAQKAGLPPITPHGFRHSCATAMAMSGVEESIVQEILGHRSRSTTRQIYIHVYLENKRKGTSALTGALGRQASDTTTSGVHEVDLETSASTMRQNLNEENAKAG